MSQRRSSRKSRGQALAEFALVAPVLFLIFFGIIEFGRFVLAYEELNNATREGARYESSMAARRYARADQCRVTW